MRKIVLFITGMVTISLLSFCQSGNGNSTPQPPITKPIISKSRIAEAKTFAIKNKMDTTVVIFIDFSTHSGKNRLFVYGYESGKILKSSLCSHGVGKVETEDSDEVVFSNVPESYCSSRGKYKIGARGWSNWGTHFNYKLHGLESTNNNAYKRIIVLHSYEFIDDKEIYPEELVNSLGCPMISNNTMKYLDVVIKKAKQPVLMWIYE